MCVLNIRTLTIYTLTNCFATAHHPYRRLQCHGIASTFATGIKFLSCGWLMFQHFSYAHRRRSAAFCCYTDGIITEIAFHFFTKFNKTFAKDW